MQREHGALVMRAAAALPNSLRRSGWKVARGSMNGFGSGGRHAIVNGAQLPRSIAHDAVAALQAIVEERPRNARSARRCGLGAKSKASVSSFSVTADAVA